MTPQEAPRGATLGTTFFAFLGSTIIDSHALTISVPEKKAQAIKRALENDLPRERRQATAQGVFSIAGKLWNMTVVLTPPRGLSLPPPWDPVDEVDGERRTPPLDAGSSYAGVESATKVLFVPPGLRPPFRVRPKPGIAANTCVWSVWLWDQRKIKHNNSRMRRDFYHHR